MPPQGAANPSHDCSCCPKSDKSGIVRRSDNRLQRGCSPPRAVNRHMRLSDTLTVPNDGNPLFKKPSQRLRYRSRDVSFAEREGFEPPRRVLARLADFESAAFNQAQPPLRRRTTRERRTNDAIITSFRKDSTLSKDVQSVWTIPQFACRTAGNTG